MVFNLMLDTNVIIDFFLDREPFNAAAKKVLLLNKEPNIQLSITASSVTDIFYITRRELKDRNAVKDKIIELLTDMSIKILPVTPEAIYMALDLPWKDFEDAVQYATACVNEMNGIVTRNVDDYRMSELNIYTPAEIVEFFNDK